MKEETVQSALGGHLPGEERKRLLMAASCGEENGKIVLLVRFRTSPHAQRWEIEAGEEGLRVSMTGPEGQSEDWDQAQVLIGH